MWCLKRGLQLYLRFAHWPPESDLIILFSIFWVAVKDTPFGHHSFCLTRPLSLKLELDGPSWVKTFCCCWMRAALHRMQFLWRDMAAAEPHYESLLMIYSVCTYVHSCVYFSGLISLVAYFLLQMSVAAISVKPSASESHADNCAPFWAVLHWGCKMCLFRFNRDCSTLNTEPSSSSSCKPTVLCCRFGARYHMGTFVLLAKRQLLII